MNPHDEVRRLLGGYVLGGLDEAEQGRVDAHLSTCGECRAEVERLAAVPELLQRLPVSPDPVPVEAPSREGLDALLRRARPVHRRRRGVLAGAAAAVALALAATGFFLRPAPQQLATPRPSPSVSAAPSAGTVVEFVAADGSKLSGRATLSPRQWGVSVALELSGLPQEGPFVLQVYDRGGLGQQAACWGHTSTSSARVTGASSIQLADVARVTVSDYEGHLLGTALR